MKTVAEYQKEMADIQEKVRLIQAACPHIMYEVAMYSWRVGTMNPSRICVDCKAVIPGITDEETKKAWAEFYKDTNDVLT